MTVVFLEPARFDALTQRINADPEFRLTARAMHHDVHLRADDLGSTFHIEQGQITSAKLAPFLESFDFMISGSGDAWTKMLRKLPPPHYHHLYAAMFRQNLHFDGNLEAAFSSLDVLSRMIELMRDEQNDSGDSNAGV